MKKTTNLNFDETISDIRKGFNEWRFHNEESVKQGIILPILYSLGWDIFDTREVYPEHNVAGGRADYVLYIDTKPILLIEAKALDKSIKDKTDDENKRQAFKYAENLYIHKIIVTDGLYWRFFINEDVELKINLWKDDKLIINKLSKLLSRNNEPWDFLNETINSNDFLTLYDDFQGKSIAFELIDKEKGIDFSCDIIHKDHESSWKANYVALCKELYKQNGEKFLSLINNPLYIGSTNKSFSEKKRKNYEPIVTGKLFANTHKGCNDFAKLIRELLKYFNITANNLSVSLMPNIDEIEQETEQTIEKIENDFVETDYIYSNEEIVIKSNKCKCFYKKGKIKFLKYESDKREYRFFFKYSKQYKTGNFRRYWYGISKSLYEQILEQKLSHIIFVTEQKHILMLPIEVLKEYYEFASIGDNGTFHISVKSVDEKLFLYSQGKEISIDNFNMYKHYQNLKH